MSDLHTNGTADRAPAGAQDDIVEQLEWHNTCVRNADGLCLLQQALYKMEHQQAEIERLRAAVERLHSALTPLSICGMVADMQELCDAFEEARRG